MSAHIKVYFAFLTNNRGGRHTDVHGRRYRDVYRRHGHFLMVDDDRYGNSWRIPVWGI